MFPELLEPDVTMQRIRFESDDEAAHLLIKAIAYFTDEECPIVANPITLLSKLHESSHSTIYVGTLDGGDLPFAVKLEMIDSLDVPQDATDQLVASMEDRFRKLESLGPSAVGVITHIGTLPGIIVTLRPFLNGGTCREEIEDCREACSGQVQWDKWRHFVGIVAATARTVGRAHSLLPSIVHADLKPENIILLEGRPVVIDWDHCVSATLSTSHCTIPRWGTEAYRPPPTVSPSYLTPEWDVWSLGRILLEALTAAGARWKSEGDYDGWKSSPEYRAGDADLAKWFEDGNRGTTRQERLRIKSLARILGKALECRPEYRYSNAQELADDLQRWLDSKPVFAKGMSLKRRFRALFLRRPLWVAAMLLTIATLLAFGFSLWNSMARRTAQRAQTLRNLGREVETILDRPEWGARDADYLRYALWVEEAKDDADSLRRLGRLADRISEAGRHGSGDVLARRIGEHASALGREAGDIRAHSRLLRAEAAIVRTDFESAARMLDESPDEDLQSLPPGLADRWGWAKHVSSAFRARRRVPLGDRLEAADGALHVVQVGDPGTSVAKTIAIAGREVDGGFALSEIVDLGAQLPLSVSDLPPLQAPYELRAVAAPGSLRITDVAVHDLALGSAVVAAVTYESRESKRAAKVRLGAVVEWELPSPQAARWALGLSAPAGPPGVGRRHQTGETFLAVRGGSSSRVLHLVPNWHLRGNHQHDVMEPTTVMKDDDLQDLLIDTEVDGGDDRMLLSVPGHRTPGIHQFEYGARRSVARFLPGFPIRGLLKDERGGVSRWILAKNFTPDRAGYDAALGLEAAIFEGRELTSPAGLIKIWSAPRGWSAWVQINELAPLSIAEPGLLARVVWKYEMESHRSQECAGILLTPSRSTANGPARGLLLDQPRVPVVLPGSGGQETRLWLWRQNGVFLHSASGRSDTDSAPSGTRFEALAQGDAALMELALVIATERWDRLSDANSLALRSLLLSGRSALATEVWSTWFPDGKEMGRNGGDPWVERAIKVETLSVLARHGAFAKHEVSPHSATWQELPELTEDFEDNSTEWRALRSRDPDSTQPVPAAMERSSDVFGSFGSRFHPSGEALNNHWFGCLRASVAPGDTSESHGITSPTFEWSGKKRLRCHGLLCLEAFHFSSCLSISLEREDPRPSTVAAMTLSRWRNTIMEPGEILGLSFGEVEQKIKPWIGWAVFLLEIDPVTHRALFMLMDPHGRDRELYGTFLRFLPEGSLTSGRHRLEIKVQITSQDPARIPLVVVGEQTEIARAGGEVIVLVDEWVVDLER